MKTTFKAAHASRMTAHQRSNALDREVDKLETRIREKMDVSTGFADTEVKARKFEAFLRNFDRNRTGYLAYKEFFVMLTNFNFVGVQREIEALFHRYDLNGVGVIGCRDFSCSIFGLEGRVLLDNHSKATIDKVVTAILDRHGGIGVSQFIQTVRSMDRDGRNAVPRQELVAAIRDFGVLRISSSEMTAMLDRLDIDKIGMVSKSYLKLKYCLFKA